MNLDTAVSFIVALFHETGLVENKLKELISKAATSQHSTLIEVLTMNSFHILKKTHAMCLERGSFRFQVITAFLSTDTGTIQGNGDQRKNQC